MQSSLESRVACLEQSTGVVNRVVFFDDAPVPDDKGKTEIRLRFIGPPRNYKGAKP